MAKRRLFWGSVDSQWQIGGDRRRDDDWKDGLRVGLRLEDGAS
jgi:hypothetical protein